MEVEEVDALPAPASQERQTSILCDGFLPLFDESLLKVGWVMYTGVGEPGDLLAIRSDDVLFI